MSSLSNTHFRRPIEYVRTYLLGVHLGSAATATASSRTLPAASASAHSASSPKFEFAAHFFLSLILSSPEATNAARVRTTVAT